MCEISIKLNTDKSPYNKSGHYGHRHAYTGIYHYLFKDIKNDNLNICEIEFSIIKELNYLESTLKILNCTVMILMKIF